VLQYLSNNRSVPSLLRQRLQTLRWAVAAAPNRRRLFDALSAVVTAAAVATATVPEAAAVAAAAHVDRASAVARVPAVGRG